METPLERDAVLISTILPLPRARLRLRLEIFYKKHYVRISSQVTIVTVRAVIVYAAAGST
jgi:hypothetical protein